MPALNSLKAKAEHLGNGHGACGLPCPAACPVKHLIQHRLTLRSTRHPIDQASINGFRNCGDANVVALAGPDSPQNRNAKAAN